MSLSVPDAVACPGPGSGIDTDAAAASGGEARNDARQRVIVDDGIAVLDSSNTMSAFEYLRAHGVRTQVIERVLLEPRRRRALA